MQHRARMFSIVLLALMAVAAAASPGTSVAAEHAAASRVTEVTVYRGAAFVAREARIPIPAGAHRIVLAGIPCVADPDSVRVSGTGSTPITIGGVEVREEFRQPDLTPEYLQLDQEIRDTTRKLAILSDRDQSLALLREFLSGLKGAAAEGSAKDTVVSSGLPVDSWRRAFEFFSARLDALSTEKRGLEAERAGLDRSAGIARARLARMTSQDAVRRWNAVVHLSAEAPGDLTLRVSYLASNASWQPLYDARLNPSSGTVSLWSRAQVSQTTGEDWLDVGLTLATSVPSAGIDLPVLASLTIGAVATVTLRDGASTAAFSSEFVDSLPVLGRNYQDVGTLAPGASDPDQDGNPDVHGSRDTEVIAPVPKPKVVPAALRQATSSRREVAVRFDLPGRYDIPSDGQAHRHVIARRDVEAVLEHRAVPGINPAAFLVATVRLPPDSPLPTGRVQHFVGDDLVGASWMSQRAGGEEVAISFGPDDRVNVERKALPKTVERRGKIESTVYRFVTTLESHLTREEVVELKDRIPVSEDGRIEVALDDDTTAGATTDPNEPGILVWRVPLRPGEKKQIVLGYRVRAPHGIALAGME